MNRLIVFLTLSGLSGAAFAHDVAVHRIDFLHNLMHTLLGRIHPPVLWLPLVVLGMVTMRFLIQQRPTRNI
ncbi:MAG: hypothetical protein Q8O31_03320 [Rhodocyclaceae bacterium]|nr:hypothetical protein [Rhodocyclaceae bacterium]